MSEHPFNKPIGGFLPLELPRGEEYHPSAIHLNSARYALEYVLRIKSYKKIYLPAYICDSVLQPIKRLHLATAFYRLDQQFMPVLERDPEKDACLLYVTYFGVTRAAAEIVSRRFKHVIIDNTQAFFEPPIAGTDTIYSARKFFGVPDGGYLYTDSADRLTLTEDSSYYRCDGLLKQIDAGHDAALPLYMENEAYLDHCGMKQMAALTKRLLESINYPLVRAQRNRNFRQLHEALGRFNRLDLSAVKLNGPLCYPFLIERGARLKNFLLDRKILVTDYWDDVLARVTPGSFEHQLATNLVALPVDQTLSESDCASIIQSVRSFLDCPGG